MQAFVAGQLQQWQERLGAAITQLTGPSVPVTLAFDDISVNGSCPFFCAEIPFKVALLQATV